jgi:hypothetical protein
MKGSVMPIESKQLTDPIVDHRFFLLAGGKLELGDRLAPEPQ